jgi:flagella basal body P-ring formation protein FlgA
MMDGTVIQDTDQAIGKMAKTTIQPGTILYHRHLKKQPLVSRGDHVTILVRHGALRVTAPGEVKNSGAEGDMIKVKNLMSRRVIYARVIHEGLVEAD